jgi:hypothetical protein
MLTVHTCALRMPCHAYSESLRLHGNVEMHNGHSGFVKTACMWNTCMYAFARGCAMSLITQATGARLQREQMQRCDPQWPPTHLCTWASLGKLDVSETSLNMLRTSCVNAEREGRDPAKEGLGRRPAQTRLCGCGTHGASKTRAKPHSCQTSPTQVGLDISLTQQH